MFVPIEMDQLTTVRTKVVIVVDFSKVFFFILIYLILYLYFIFIFYFLNVSLFFISFSFSLFCTMGFLSGAGF